MADNYDPAHVACDPLYDPCEECCMSPVGPGGKSTNIENNEKGILESGLQALISYNPKRADLGSAHDGQRQGIYATNSVGDND